MTRWIRTTVDILDHEMFEGDTYSRRDAWLWLLTHAAWKDKRVSHKGAPLDLKRGQVLVGRAHLAQVFGWTEQNVRTFTNQLIKRGMIEISNQSNGHFANVATICNYDKYQSIEQDERPVDQPVSNQCPTSVQPEPNQTSTSTTISTKDADAVTRETVGTKIDLKALSDQVTAACNGALASQAIAPGLASMSIPWMWIEQGADLERDILPTLTAIGKKQHGKGIRTWDYFTEAVAQAKAKRLAGLPDVVIPLPGQRQQTPAFHDFRAEKRAREQAVMSKLRLG